MATLTALDALHTARRAWADATGEYQALLAAARVVVDATVSDDGHRWVSVEREYIDALRAVVEGDSTETEVRA